MVSLEGVVVEMPMLVLQRRPRGPAFLRQVCDAPAGLGFRQNAASCAATASRFNMITPAPMRDSTTFSESMTPEIKLETAAASALPGLTMPAGGTSAEVAQDSPPALRILSINLMNLSSSKLIPRVAYSIKHFPDE